MEAAASVNDRLSAVWHSAGEEAAAIVLLQQVETIVAEAAQLAGQLELGHIDVLESGSPASLAELVTLYPAVMRGFLDSVRDILGIDALSALTVPPLQAMTSLFSVLLLVGGLAAVTGVRSWYAVCQPNQVLVIYGWRSRRQRGEERLIGYRLLKGGSSFVFPLVEEVAAMDVGNLIIPLTVPNALTRGGIRISVEAVANVKVASREPAIHAAVERLLGKTTQEIKALAQVTLESNLRGMLATLTPEQVNADREAFAVAMLAEAEDDLRQLGLDLDSLQITALTDDARFLDSLGRPQQVELLRQSRIAEAEAQALERIQEAERRIRDAVSRETALVAEAEAQIAGERARVKAECARAVALAKGGAAAILDEGAARAEGLNALVASWRQAGPDARAVYLTQRLPALLPLLRGADGGGGGLSPPAPHLEEPDSASRRGRFAIGPG